MLYTTYKHGDEWGMVYHCYTHIIPNVMGWLTII